MTEEKSARHVDGALSGARELHVGWGVSLPVVQARTARYYLQRAAPTTQPANHVRESSPPSVIVEHPALVTGRFFISLLIWFMQLPLPEHGQSW